MKLLGVDYGTKRVGLALSEFGWVNPWQVLIFSRKFDRKEAEIKMIKKIAKICHDRSIQKVVIGLPEGRLVTKVKDFGERLGLLAKVTVVFQDETLTTQEAIDKMMASHTRQQKRRDFQDAVAAALILQEYLNKNNV